MYNYQTFRREQIVAQHCQSIRRQYLNHQTKRQQSCPSLAHNHKKRVEAFILSAIDKPVPVSQYKNQPPCFRNTTGPTLGSKGFYIRRQSQSQRIEHSMKQNSELDCRPFNNTATHQFRESKGKGLKYKPLTESLRVKDYLDRQELNYLPNSSIKEDKLTRKAMTGEKVNLLNLNKTLHKTLLPVLHAKTYFKSVSTLFTEIPAAQKRPETSVCLNDDTGEEIQGGERRPVKAKDHMSRKQNSRQALVKCNMLSNVLRA